MYSLMSIRIKASSESKRYFAKTFARYVFPTPVGPRKMKLPIGLLGSFKPALLRLMAFTTFLIASSCPMTVPASSDSMLIRRSPSFCAIRCTGTPVIIATTSATFCSVTVSRWLFVSLSQAFLAFSSFSTSDFSSSRYLPASSKRCSFIASFFC